MMPRRERARRLLRGLLELVALIVVAVGVGVLLGVALSQLTGGDEPRGGLADPSTTAEPSTTSTARSAATTSRRPGRQDPLEQVRVSVISAVLHPATTPSGIRRRRGRLAVHVRVENRGTQRIVPERPSLLAARQRVPTNPRADERGTRLGAIGAGRTADVTLRFETAGEVTEQLTTQKRARVVVAGTSSPITVKVGNPVRSRKRSGATAP